MYFSIAQYIIKFIEQFPITHFVPQFCFLFLKNFKKLKFTAIFYKIDQT